MAKQPGLKGKAKKGKGKDAKVLDRHYLYSAAVQSVEPDLDFFKRVYRKEAGRPFRRLREDFCGTAVLAREWVRRNAKNEAWGIDLDQPTLDWGEKHYGPRLGQARERLHLTRSNVLDVTRPRVDVVAALNFSYSVFKTRKELGGYFRQVRRSLSPQGLFFIDAWGGAEAMCEDKETRRIAAEKAWDGTRVPSFKYVWEQKRFNPIDHAITCHIHFQMLNGKKMKRAFTYDWRLWSLPEIAELMADAGFSKSMVYIEGWDDKADETDGVFRKKSYFENQDAWVVYVVGVA